MKLRVFCCLLLGLAGCATAPAAHPRRGEEAVFLELHAITPEQAGFRCAAPDGAQPIAEGERLEILIDARRPVHAYAARVSQGGPELLPMPEAAAASSVRIPAPGEYLRLTGQPGREDLRVVVSSRPLAGEEVRALSIRDALREEPPDPPENKRQCPRLGARLDETGVAVLRLLLRTR